MLLAANRLYRHLEGTRFKCRQLYGLYWSCSLIIQLHKAGYHAYQGPPIMLLSQCVRIFRVLSAKQPRGLIPAEFRFCLPGIISVRHQIS